MLSAEKDALGMPRTKLEWSLGEQERKTFKFAFRALAAEFAKNTWGRLVLTVNEDQVALNPNHHQMGTTKMGRDARSSVVNSDCRVHSINNLYVAGSSVFPTSGVSNPTLTIVAMSLRLAKHLEWEIHS